MSKAAIRFALLVAALLVSFAPAFAKGGGNGTSKFSAKTDNSNADRSPAYTGNGLGLKEGRPPGHTGNGAGLGAGGRDSKT